MKDWKKLERHPISEAYPDITGRAWDDFLEHMRTYGLGDRKITLHEGKVLDGWQLQRACVELEIEPSYGNLRKGVDPYAFVERYNNMRRHESMEMIQRRREQRIERVAEAHRNGESKRQIAEKEGVSETTIRDDLSKADAKGFASEPDDNKVTTKDGKRRDSSTKKLCQRCARVGAVADCPACKEVNRKKPPKAKPAKPPKPPKNGAVLFDDKIILDLIGKLARAICERAKATGDTPGHRDMMQKHEQLITAWDRWQLEKK